MSNPEISGPISAEPRRFTIRIRRRQWIGLLIVIFPIGLFVAGQLWLRSTALEWMANTSGVRLPGGTREISVSRDHESFMTAHALLPAADVSNFAQEYSFLPVSKVPFGLMGIDELAPRFREIPETAKLAAQTGRSRSNKWTYVMDLRTGHLWFTVEMPDWSGDLP